MTRALTFLLLGLAMLTTGCPSSSGGETPQATFELGLSYIRDGKYDRVWTLWSETQQAEYARQIEKQKVFVRKVLAGADQNVEMVGQFLARQYGLGPKEFVAAPAHELAARSFEYGRARALRLRIVGDVRIDGDRATLRVEDSADGIQSEWTMVRKDDGRWYVDQTPIIGVE